MLQKNVIIDLVTWLERNLAASLSVEVIAGKSGYTQWHLQRLFKLYTGYSLGKYILARRLTKAAFEMRFTNITILDMALKSNFTSNQTFSRAFKDRFALSPYPYRHTDAWNFSHLCPPLNNLLPMQPVTPRVRVLPEITLMGVEKILFSSVEDYINNWGRVASRLWQSFIKQIVSMPEKTYGIKRIRPGGGGGNLHYIIAVEPTLRFRGDPFFKKIIIPAGQYLCFEYYGPDHALHDYVMYLYESYLPLHGITRRYGDDVEIFYHRRQTQGISYPLSCEYCIPV